MDKFDEIGKGEPCKTCWFGPVFPSCIKIVGDCGSHNKWHGYEPDVWDAETNPELARNWIAKRLAARRPSAEPVCPECGIKLPGHFYTCSKAPWGKDGES